MTVRTSSRLMPSRRLEIFGSTSLPAVAQPAASSAPDNTNAAARRRPWRTCVLPRGSYVRQSLSHNPDRDLTGRWDDFAEKSGARVWPKGSLQHYLEAIEHSFKKAPQTLELYELAASWPRSGYGRGDGGFRCVCYWWKTICACAGCWQIRLIAPAMASTLLERWPSSCAASPRCLMT